MPKEEIISRLEKYKLRASKKMLLFLAGFFWCFAGGKVFTLGYEDLFLNTNNLWGYLLIALVIFLLFFILIFRKLVKKHIMRIMSSHLSEHCIFSFFDFKGYLIMIVMIAGGITLRNAQVIEPFYLGSFYMGLGSALFLAGLLFFESVLTSKALNLNKNNAPANAEESKKNESEAS